MYKGVFRIQPRQFGLDLRDQLCQCSVRLVSIIDDVRAEGTSELLLVDLDLLSRMDDLFDDTVNVVGKVFLEDNRLDRGLERAGRVCV